MKNVLPYNLRNSTRAQCKSTKTILYESETTLLLGRKIWKVVASGISYINIPMILKFMNQPMQGNPILFHRKKIKKISIDITN